jgi:agmatinase
MSSDPRLPADFDPAAAASYDGIFGLPFTPDDAEVVVIPVPWDVTTSYRPGTSLGPAAVLEASRQVDLFDLETGRPYERGIAMLPVPDDVLAWNADARAIAEPVIAAGGAGADLELMRRVVVVDEFGDRVNDWVRARTDEVLARGRTPVVLGGDHSTPFGAIAACAERHPGLGVLHFDAHYDLREAFEGFRWSHASIMFNVLGRVPGVARIVHVGVRDFSEDEHRLSQGSGGRSVGYPDLAIRDRLAAGETWNSVADEIASKLPPEVWVSFDIDGLDPALCPGTGTPVPGGLSLHQATSILAACVRRGVRIVGCDLNEVAPREGDGEWNANVGARVLYKLIGFALASRPRD